MTTSKDVASAVILIAQDFAARGDVSFHALLIESGWPDDRHLVQVDDIERALRLRPELVASWAQYSADKRSSEGWYFDAAASGGWVVAYAGGRALDDGTFAVDDETVACAIFIQKELEAACP